MRRAADEHRTSPVCTAWQIGPLAARQCGPPYSNYGRAGGGQETQQCAHQDAASAGRYARELLGVDQERRKERLFAGAPAARRLRDIVQEEVDLREARAQRHIHQPREHLSV